MEPCVCITSPLYHQLHFDIMLFMTLPPVQPGFHIATSFRKLDNIPADATINHPRRHTNYRQFKIIKSLRSAC